MGIVLPRVMSRFNPCLRFNFVVCLLLAELRALALLCRCIPLCCFLAMVGVPHYKPCSFPCGYQKWGGRDRSLVIRHKQGLVIRILTGRGVCINSYVNTARCGETFSKFRQMCQYIISNETHHPQQYHELHDLGTLDVAYGVRFGHEVLYQHATHHLVSPCVNAIGSLGGRDFHNAAPC